MQLKNIGKILEKMKTFSSINFFRILFLLWFSLFSISQLLITETDAFIITIPFLHLLWRKNKNADQNEQSEKRKEDND